MPIELPAGAIGDALEIRLNFSQGATVRGENIPLRPCHRVVFASKIACRSEVFTPFVQWSSEYHGLRCLLFCRARTSGHSG